MESDVSSFSRHRGNSQIYSSPSDLGMPGCYDVLFAIELAKERSMLNLLPGLYGSRTTILRDVNTELSAARPGSPARQGAGHE